jgi:hypothetical protein
VGRIVHSCNRGFPASLPLIFRRYRGGKEESLDRQRRPDVTNMTFKVVFLAEKDLHNMLDSLEAVHSIGVLENKNVQAIKECINVLESLLNPTRVERDGLIVVSVEEYGTLHKLVKNASDAILALGNHA